MSSADFRQIAIATRSDRSEQLFRAAVSAFCSLTRPTRREIQQLEHLALPLFDEVSREGRRYVSAALSESPSAPHALVRRLAEQPADIAAPILLRSPVLSDADLVALIAREGLGHARVIARRARLNPALVQLVRALEASSKGLRVVSDAIAAPRATPSVEGHRTPADEARAGLRAMMADGEARTEFLPPIPARPDREALATLLHGMAHDRRAAVTAWIAERIELSSGALWSVLRDAVPGEIALALRATGLPPEFACLVAIFLRPDLLRQGTSSIAAVLRQALHADDEAAREWLRNQKARLHTRRIGPSALPLSRQAES